VRESERVRKKDRKNPPSVVCGHDTTESEKARERKREKVRKRERENLLPVVCGHDRTPH